MKKVYILLIFFITGCASALKVDRISDIDPKEKTLVLMNETKWNVKIRRELLRQGFEVKRLYSVKDVEIKKTDKITEKFSMAEARYGLTVVPGSIVDWCIGGNAKKYADFTLEVTDLNSNSVVMIVEQGGWTDTCLGMFGDLFPALAKALKENWK